ncbi:MAG: hypothetical protein ACK4UN_01975 [Limisphaerales bacterium]
MAEVFGLAVNLLKTCVDLILGYLRSGPADLTRQFTSRPQVNLHFFL